MYKNIESLTSDLKQYIFKRNSENTLDAKAQELMAALKQQEQFRDWSDDELYSYAIGRIGLSFAKRVDIITENYLPAVGKPNDPIWSQFTYDEILDMADDGVNVPQEFLDWANSMAAADTTSYELDTSASSDSCTDENIDNQSDDSTLLGRQKKLQKFSSKAVAQQDLLEDKNLELQEQNADLTSLQNDLELNQQMTMRRIEDYSNEFNILNNKFNTGASLSEDEIRRYKELGMILNVESQELLAQSASVSSELEDLMNQMSEADNIVDINLNIAKSLDSLGIQYANEEGSKNFGSLSQTGGLFVTGDLQLYAYAAQSQSLTSTAITISSDLNIDSTDLQFKINMNASMADVTTRNINNINKNNDIIYETDPAITADTEEPTAITGSTTPEPVEEQSAEPAEEPAETTVTEPIEEPAEEPTEATVTEPIEEPAEEPAEATVAEPVEEPAEELAEATVAEPVEEPAEIPAVEPEADQAAVVEPEAVDVPEQVDIPEGEQNEETLAQTDIAISQNSVSAEAELSVPEDEALSAPAQTVINNSAARTDELQTLNSEITAAVDQSTVDENIMLNEDELFRSRYNSRIKEYRDLLSRIRNQNSVADADIQSSQLINRDIEAQSDGYLSSMQAQIDNFNNSAITEEPDNVSENIDYGLTAIETGQDYPAQVQMNNAREAAGNSGETVPLAQTTEDLGVNTVNAGANLVNTAQAVLQSSVTANSSNTSGGRGEELLAAALSTSNSELEDLNQQFSEALQETNMQQFAGQNFTVAPGGLSVGTGSETENVDETDAADLEATASRADIQAQEAKRQDEQAVKDRKNAQADIRRNSNLLNNNENRITTISRNVQQNSELIDNINLQVQSTAGEQPETANSELTQVNSVNSGQNTALPDTANGAAESSEPSQDTENIAMLGEAVEESQQIGQRVTSDGTVINVLEGQSEAADKQMNTLYTAKAKDADADQKQAEEAAAVDQRAINTVTIIGNTFTATKAVGLGLMAVPWTYGAGVVMYNVGRYGELASYAANASLNIANGNLLGAAANIGAAAISFMSAPPASSTAMRGVRSASTSAANAVLEVTGRSSDSEASAAAGQEAVDQTTETVSEITQTPLPEDAETPDTAEQEPAEDVDSAINEEPEITDEAEISPDDTSDEDVEPETADDNNISTDSDMQDEVDDTNETRAVNSTAKETIADFTAADIAEEVAADIYSDINTDIEDEVNNETVNTVSSQAAAEIVPSAVTPSPVSVASVISAASVSEFEAAAATNLSDVSSEISTEQAVKTLTDDNAEFWIKDAALSVAKSTMLTQGDRLLQKDTKDDTRRKVLLRFEQKKRDEIKKGIEEVNKSARMKH